MNLLPVTQTVFNKRKIPALEHYCQQCPSHLREQLLGPNDITLNHFIGIKYSDNLCKVIFAAVTKNKTNKKTFT